MKLQLNQTRSDRDTGSDRDSRSDNSSDSSSDDSSSDDSSDGDDGEKLMKPVYVKKSQRQSRITKPSPVVKFDGGKVANTIEEDEVIEDDIDDVDPELEYNQWKQRELFRYNRDLLMMKENDRKNNNKNNNKNKNNNDNDNNDNINDNNNNNDNINDNNNNINNNNNDQVVMVSKSVFFNDTFDHLKRDFSTIESQDHSRPLKRSQKK